MEKLADFLVRRRIPILIFMLVLTAVFACLIPSVEVNTDMTKYLADSSNMKQGIDLMDEEFPDLTTTYEIRVMFTDLADEEKEDIASRLEQIKYVDSVSYEKDDDAYNRDKYTLYSVNTEYDFGTTEETAILDEIDATFNDYTYVSEETNSTKTNLPLWVIVVALIVMMIILFAMSGSWVEPLLFVVVIGCAVALNMGTNIFKGMVSQTTFSIAAILQLVLSMDYSIIIMNRYRLEVPLAENHVEAMKHTLKNSFMAVTSSAVTTFVGLLMLVFMSFKIGPDLGIVLAKGVLFSLLCVFTILPCLILIFRKAIKKTAKPVLPIPTGKLASFSYRGRLPLTCAAVAILIGAYCLQSFTGISFASTKESEISKVFPAENSVVVLYNNEDEDKIASLVDSLDGNEKVTSTYSSPTTLEKQRTAEGMLDMTQDMGSDTEIEPYMLKLMYYRYHKGDELPSIKVADLLNFIADDVVNNESFSDRMDNDIKDNVSQIKKFANKETLTKKMSLAELADFFEMDESDLKKMCVLYYKDRNDAGTGTLTLRQFVQFLQTDILSDDSYSSMIDSSMSDSIDTFAIFTDQKQYEKPLTYDQAAESMGMDASQMKLLYVYYYAQQDSYTPSSMSLAEFVTFLQTSVLTDSTFSSSIDSSVSSNLSQLAAYLVTPEAQVSLNAEQMAQLLGMDATSVKTLYVLHDSYGDTSSWRLSLKQIVEFILANQETFSSSLGDNIDDLELLEQIMESSRRGTSYTYNKLADFLSMDSSDLKQLYLLYQSMYGDTSKWGMTPQQFVNFALSDILTNEDYSSEIDDSQAEDLDTSADLINAVVSDKPYSVSDAYALMTGLTDSMSENDLTLLYIYYGSKYAYDDTWTMSATQLFDYLNNVLFKDPVFADVIDEETRANVQDAKGDLDEAAKSLKGSHYSILSITTTYDMESTDTFAFLKDLHEMCDQELSGDHYFIGNSAMYYEMSQSFRGEMLLMTLLTAISIFIIVLISFRSVAIPTLLVLLVQTAVFATVGVSFVRGYSINYLAYLIVQCILMGATIDYAILMTNNYRESRKSTGINKSLHYAYSASMHTILTSGLIMILVTGILGFAVSDPNIGPICQTISIGTLVAVILIIFILPAMLAAFDRFVCKKGQRAPKEL